jgi:hypothetical protein
MKFLNIAIYVNLLLFLLLLLLLLLTPLTSFFSHTCFANPFLSLASASKKREAKYDLNGSDTCTSLNIPGARFVQRDVFETSPSYHDAFERVRNHWWKYVLTARLCVLAMAKQKRMFLLQNPKIINTSDNCIHSETLKTSKKRKKSTTTTTTTTTPSKNNSQDQFSRRVSGILMKAINSGTDSMF